MKKLIIGIIVSAAFIYLSIKGVEFDKVSEGLKNIDYRFLPPAVIIAVLLMLLRSIRLCVILSPIEKLKQKYLFMCLAMNLINLSAFCRVGCAHRLLCFALSIETVFLRAS